jgi:SAM-dependent methyltransferase
MTASAPAPIDPLAPVVGGTYRDGLVEVRAAGPVRPRRELRSIRTAHFDVQPRGATVRVDHSVPHDLVDDDLAGMLADELFGPGWLRGSDLFERIFTGIVLTSAGDPAAGWDLFYRNTMARVDREIAGSGGPHGTIAGYAPVYAHAESLLAAGSVLEVGCCFGFLALRLARDGRQVLASDVNAGTVSLLSSVAPRLGIPLETATADAARVSLPDGAAGNVLVVHLIEHLERDHGDRVVREAVRLASDRVVVGVPLEDEANETWGHVRTVSLADLSALGEAIHASTGWHHDVHEHHGGWLVLDRP